MKRLFDIVFSLTMLIILSPFLLAIAVAIKLTDRGPALYRQTRIGRYGKPFKVLKFRSMYLHHTFKSEITIKRDPRVTRIGRVLRATKLDELPQLWNVLIGEMSIVGPRPESPRFVAHYTDHERATLAVRPGLTGPASVLFRSQEQLLTGENFEDYYVTVLMPTKAQINLDYIQRQSLWLDLKIIAHTIVVLLHPASVPPLIAPAETAPLAPPTRRETPAPMLARAPAPRAEP